MNVERLAQEFVNHQDHLKVLTKKTEEIKEMLSKAVDRDGVPDDVGHRWMTAGRFTLKRERRQGKPYLDLDAAAAWAKAGGFWEEVSVTPPPVTVLDMDALDTYVYEHRGDKQVEKEYKALYVTPDPTWAFIRPTEQDQFDDL